MELKKIFDYYEKEEIVEINYKALKKPQNGTTINIECKDNITIFKYIQNSLVVSITRKINVIENLVFEGYITEYVALRLKEHKLLEQKEIIEAIRKDDIVFNPMIARMSSRLSIMIEESKLAPFLTPQNIMENASVKFEENK